MTLDSHDLQLNGMPALLKTLQDLDERITTLEILWSEEIMAGLASPAQLREEVVAELGAGWRVERIPADYSTDSAADHITDAGLTYRQLDALLHPATAADKGLAADAAD